MSYRSYEHLYIGGNWERPAGDEQLVVRSPATIEEIGRVPAASRADIDRAVRVARDQQDSAGSPWRTTSIGERAALLREIGARLHDREDEMRDVLSAETGQPVGKTTFHVRKALNQIDYVASLAESVAIEERREGTEHPYILRREPVGVVGIIVPWNAPLSITFFALGPAIAAGCSVILKPAPETPLHAQLLAEILDEAAVPKGVISILPADREASEALVAHPGVDKISFTGSTETGRRVAEICARTIKRYTLELGGKSAAIVLDDADLDVIIPPVVAAATTNSGEACVGQTRILIPRSRRADVLDSLVDGVARLCVGDPRDPSTDIGPLISERQRRRVEGYIEAGRSEGADLVLGGGRPPDQPRGWFVEPTVFSNVHSRMRIAQEEIFGPVLSIIEYDDVADAIMIANDTQFGLSGTVWTSDVERGLEVARQVRSGNYGVNAFFLDNAAPFGGFKKSGVGRTLGREGLESMFELKAIMLPK